MADVLDRQFAQAQTWLEQTADRIAAAERTLFDAARRVAGER
jgi:hypothetical protein